MHINNNKGVVPVIVLVILGIAAMLGMLVGGFGSGLWFGQGTKSLAEGLGWLVIFIFSTVLLIGSGIAIFMKLPQIIKQIKRTKHEIDKR